MRMLVLAMFLISAIPAYGEDLDSKEVSLMCRRSYLKLKLYLAPQQVSLGGGLNFGGGSLYGGVDPRQQYCVPAPQYSPPQLYAPERSYVQPAVPEARPYVPPPQPQAYAVCPDSEDILKTLAVLHFLANNDARRDSRRDADRGDSELNKDSLMALQLFQGRGRDELSKEGLATLKILENQMTQIGLSQAQTVLLREIVDGMRAAMQPPPGPEPRQLPYQPPERLERAPVPGPAPAPPPTQRSMVPPASGTQGRVFYRDTVYRK